MHTHEGMKARNIHAHEIKLDVEFLCMVKGVKSDATDCEVNKYIAKELSTDEV